MSVVQKSTWVGFEDYSKVTSLFLEEEILWSDKQLQGFTFYFLYKPSGTHENI